MTVTRAFDSSLVKGSTIDSVICRDHKDQSYALYLPTYYASQRSFPCIFFFDAHARGILPVNDYKAIAEKYGFVLVGSNNSKNGIEWDETNAGIKALMADVQQRINIDAKRIYAAGFSGGSRVACSIAMADGGVAGVIGCAAGYPVVRQGAQGKFDYFGIVGDHDFNLSEMEQWDGTLEQNGLPHQLLTSAGTHGWAAVADFETALLWLQAMAVKEHLQAKNDTLLTALKEDYSRRIAAQKASGDWVKAQQLLDGMTKAFEGLTDISEYKKQLFDLLNSDEYKKAQAERQQLQKDEQKQQGEISATFPAHDEAWWAKKISDLNRNINTSKSPAQSQMNGRILAYLGFVAYMNASNAIKAGKLQDAANYVRVFKIADPKNPDGNYLLALVNAKKGDGAAAIAALSQAIAQGYNDVGQLLSETSFNGIKNNAAFGKLISLAAANNNLK